MTGRRAGVLAWGLWALFVLSQLFIVVAVTRYDAPADALFGLVLIGYATVGALIASRRPDNLIGWLLLAIATTTCVTTGGEVYAALGDDLPGRLAVAWLAAVLWDLWLVLTVVALPLVFPTGRLVSRRWLWVARLGLLALLLGGVGTGFSPGRLDLEVAVENPLGASGSMAEVVRWVDRAGESLIAAAFLLAITSLVVRFRRAEGVERAQLKWFVLVGVVMAGALTMALMELLWPGGVSTTLGTIGWLTFLFSSCIGVPLATGVAVLRHRLYDIDVVIKRTLVYGSVTAVLAVTYLGLVLAFRLVLQPVAGTSDLAVATSTLAVAGLFRPVRSRVQGAVDRRFYRARYDVARTLEAFSGRLRDELDLDTLGRDLRDVVGDTMQPAHVSLWVREGPR